MPSILDRILNTIGRTAPEIENKIVQRGMTAAEKEAADKLAQKLATEETLSKVDDYVMPRSAKDSADFFKEALPPETPKISPEAQAYMEKQGQLDKTFAGQPKSAADSFKTFDENSNANFQLVDNTRPVDPSKALTTPYPRQVLADGVPQQERGLVPRGTRMPDEIIEPAAMRDVTPPLSRLEEPQLKLTGGEPVPMMTPKSGMGWKSKAAIGGGTALAGLAALGLFNKDNTVDPSLRITKDMSQANPDAPMTVAPTTPVEAPPQPTNVKASVATGSSTKNSTPKTAAKTDGGMLNASDRVLDFGDQNADTAAALRDAQERENRAILINQLGKAGSIIGSGIAGATEKPNTEGFDQNMKLAGRITEQHKAQMEKEKDDPNSTYSKGLRSFLTKMGYQIKGNPTASELEKMTPLAQKYVESVENRKEKQREFNLRLDEAKDRKEALGIQKQIAADEKKEKENVRRIDNFGKVISGDAGRAGAIGQERIKYNNIKHVQAIMNGAENLDDVPQVQLVEIARAMDRVISGGNPTISTTEELTPANARTWIANKLSWAASQPVGAGQKSYLDMYSHMLDRQLDVTKANMAEAATRLSGSLADLKDHQNMKTTLLANNLPADLFDYEAPKQRRENNERVKEKMKSGMSIDDAKKQVVQELKQQKAGKQPGKEVTSTDKAMVSQYKAMADTDPNKAVLGKILSKKGLLNGQ